MITIVNYGMGNLGSIKNMLRKLGHDSIITSDPNIIENSQKLILPGVGSFDTGMKQLKQMNIEELLHRKATEEEVPILGICLGAQLMCSSSGEGSEKGLGWFDADVLSFRDSFQDDINLPVPNMGWIDVEIKKQSQLTELLPENPRFYFVHSYYIKANNNKDILLQSNYGFDYTSGLQRKNIYGVQFHPEKSHKYGFQLLKNFADL